MTLQLVELALACYAVMGLEWQQRLSELAN